MFGPTHWGTAFFQVMLLSGPDNMHLGASLGRQAARQGAKLRRTSPKPSILYLLVHGNPQSSQVSSWRMCLDVIFVTFLKEPRLFWAPLSYEAKIRVVHTGIELGFLQKKMRGSDPESNSGCTPEKGGVSFWCMKRTASACLQVAQGPSLVRQHPPQTTGTLRTKQTNKQT